MTQTQKIGDLAAATGLTVRTLHYYEEIGLLPPPARTRAGHRVYGEQHVERIYRILLLRRLGLSLDDVASALGDEDWDPRVAMARHLADVDARLVAMGRLRGRLAHVLGAQGDERTEERAEKPMVDRSRASTADLLRIVEDMNMLDNAIQRRISILVYADMEAAFDYLVRVFRPGPGKLHARRRRPRRARRDPRRGWLIFPRFGGRSDYAANAASCDLNSNSIGLT